MHMAIRNKDATRQDRDGQSKSEFFLTRSTFTRIAPTSKRLLRFVSTCAVRVVAYATSSIVPRLACHAIGPVFSFSVDASVPKARSGWCFDEGSRLKQDTCVCESRQSRDKLAARSTFAPTPCHLVDGLQAWGPSVGILTVRREHAPAAGTNFALMGSAWFHFRLLHQRIESNHTSRPAPYLYFVGRTTTESLRHLA